VERRLWVAPRLRNDLHCIECDDRLQYIIPIGSYSVSPQSENRYYDKMLLKQERLNETVKGQLNVDIKASSSAILFELQPVQQGGRIPGAPTCYGPESTYF